MSSRSKRTPEEKARRERIRELLQLNNIGSMDDIQNLFKETIAEFMENGLDAELDTDLGYSKYDYKNKETDNSRNGHSSKTLRTSFGDVEVAVPRDRKGEFEPQLLKKNQTSISQDIEEKILSMYAKGMSTGDIETHIRDIYGIAYFGGITQTVTPDNCKVAVTENKDWINPSVNKDFQAWAEHNGTVIMPAKVRKPRWKPNVEGHVKIVTMHILVDMDEMTFYSLEELNAVLWEKMEQENRVNFQGLTYSRWELFEREEKESLLPLPETSYEYLERKMVKVSQDFSFTYDKVHYSMPRKYLKRTLEIRAGATKIYVYNENGDLIRTHDRSYTPKSWVVIPSDMPKEYSDYGYWNKPYFLAKAERVGPDTKILIERVMEKFQHPVQSFRSCYGILNFAEKYGKAALEECCHDAILYGKCNYTYISNTISMYAKPAPEPVDRSGSSLKPANRDTVVTGVYKDDDEKYSLKNLLKRQEEGDSK